MSHNVINDAPDPSSDSGESDNQKEDLRSIIRMMKSSDQVDKRFMDLYKLKKAGVEAA